MKLLSPFFLLVVLLIETSSAPAAPISWGSAQQMTDPSNVVNTGTAVDAAVFYAGTLSINGVTFNTLTGTGSSQSGTTFTDSGAGNISVTLGSGGGAQSGTSFVSGGSDPDKTNYNDLAGRFGYTTTSGSVQLSGLTNNLKYQVEVWTSASNYALAGDITTFSGSPSVNLTPELNQYAVGTFTASSATETFSFVPDGGTFGFLNAVSVREIPSSAPEPSAWALIVSGLALLAVMRRKRTLAL